MLEREVSRRGFLRGLFGVAAAVAVAGPLVIAPKPQVEPQVEPKTQPETHLTREQLIAKALETPEGRKALAAAMVAPIRRSLDYQGIGRKLLMVETLPMRRAA